MRPATWEYYKALGLPRPSRKLFRLLRGPYSISELARQMDIDTETVRQWEDGTTQPGPPLLRQLVDHYRMYAERYGRDPLKLLRATTRPSAPAVPAKKPAGTAAAPRVTASKQDAASTAPHPPAPPPSISEGGAKKMLSHPQGE